MFPNKFSQTLLKGKSRLKQLKLGLLACMGLVLSACGSYVAHPPAQIPDGKQTYQDQVTYLGRDYLLSPGDELEIIYHINVELQDQYQLAIGDQIRVEFVSYPQFDRTVDIRPDGKITVPYLGDLDAVGLTPPELAARVDLAYSTLMKRPRCTITLIRFGQRIRDLKDAIKTASRGQSRLVLVAPDGRASMPLIKPILVAGKTIEQAEREITAAYNKIIPGMQTSTTLLTARGNIFYIFGAVSKPGFYELRGPTTVTQGVAIAGGLTPAAESASTLLITRNEENFAVGRLINLSAVLSSGNLGKDTMLRQADVIFVPNTRLSEAAIVASFIQSIIPYSFSFSYGLQQQVLPNIQLR